MRFEDHADHEWRESKPCVYCVPCGVRLYQGTLPGIPPSPFRGRHALKLEDVLTLTPEEQLVVALLDKDLRSFGSHAAQHTLHGLVRLGWRRT